MEDFNGQAKSPGTQQEETIPPFMEATQPLNTNAGTEKQEDLVTMAQSLLTKMQELRQEFDTKIKYDETKERQLDSMHKELQAYREGLHFKILRPLFIDLIAMHDDLDKLLEGLSSIETEQIPARMIDNLKSFQDTVEDILFRNGVESYRLDGDAYVPNKQRVVQAVNTTEPSQDKLIARRVRKGFEYDGRVLRPELVTIFRAI
jgi:molecular chaperone GrpE